MVIARKPGFGNDCWTGARLTARMYSVLATLKRHRIDLEHWLHEWLGACAAAGRAPSDLAPWLPWVRIPNLVSHLFKRLARQLPRDWHERNRITPVLIETFVETPRFIGTAYKASGWIHVGTTQGRGRQDTHRQCAVPKKHIWLKPLHKNWKRLLNP